ncbi:MAG: helix-hairpin-helix domain-containing protein [Bacteroidales bacterium]|nr:helix-hairpin-helix domain-containing protein [Bacteroidales bacterium]
MNRKKGGNTHTQIIGIIWLSAGVVLVAVALFFMFRSSNIEGNKVNTPNKEPLSEEPIPDYRRIDRRHNNGYQRPKSYTGNTTPRTTQTPDTSIYSHPWHRKALVVELNSADTTTLQLLRGIGPTFARRIVAYRNRLGGFYHKGQLLEVYGMDSVRLQTIAPFIDIDTTSVQRLKINSLGLKELLRHPYFGYYQVADIVRLRQHGITLGSIDDLRSVPSVADSDAQRLAPYLDFSL